MKTGSVLLDFLYVSSGMRNKSKNKQLGTNVTASN